MSANEDLYREMQQKDEDDDQRFLHGLTRKAQPRKLINENEAKARFEKDIAPVLERRRRAEAGLPLTSSPFKNFFIRLSGRDKLPDPVVIVNPNEGIAIQAGKTAEEIRQEMIENPGAFQDLAKQAPKVQPVSATRKTVRDIIQP